MAETYRVVGPPGTGKTTYLAQKARGAVGKYGPDKVLVASLTKAAAAEAAGRSTGLPKRAVGTLHSHCYRALEGPQLVEAEHVREWNSIHRGMQMTASGTPDEKGAAVEAGDGRKLLGDELMASADILRAAMTPYESWPPQVAAFATKWNAFKRSLGLMDFTDLIEAALSDVGAAPGKPDVILIDEAQDLSKLEVALVERWGESAESVLLVGDPFQALYGWRGADPEVLAGKINRILDQSWRVPRLPQERAMRLIQRAETYDPRIVYRPRDEDGSVALSGATWMNPEPLLNEIERYAPVMILASCDYQLNPIKAVLRERGIPYHNPYTHRWNPIGERAREVIAAATRLAGSELGGEDGMLTYGDIKRLDGALLAARLWEPGGKRAFAELPQAASQVEILRFAERWMSQQAKGALATADIAWLDSALKSEMRNSMSLPMRAVRRGGLPALAEDPPVILGTIHSVKGGQCRTVAVFPDLSPKATLQAGRRGWDGRDAIYRQFYVALTRAQERLVLCTPVPRRGDSSHVNL